MDDKIQPMDKEHAAAAARLHAAEIRTGFLSSLGVRFLRQIYAAVPSCGCSFGYVRLAEDSSVLGFIACAESTGRFYKQGLRRRGAWMALSLAKFLLRPSVLRRIWQTLRYPAKAGQELPAAEILSIAVSAAAQGQGIGKALMQAAMAEFARRGVSRVKVAVGAELTAANRFYPRCGFELVETRMHHGRPMNVYAADLSSGGHFG